MPVEGLPQGCPGGGGVRGPGAAALLWLGNWAQTSCSLLDQGCWASVCPSGEWGVLVPPMGQL